MARQRWGASAGARRIPNGELLDADYLVAAEVEPGSTKFNLSKPFGRARHSWEEAFADADEREGKCPQ